MARRTAALLALASGLTLAPFSPAAPPAGGTFRVAEPAQYVTSIDAALAFNQGDRPWLSATCASLMHLQDKPLPDGYRIAPELAAAFPRISADGKTYTFTIRKEARFSTGAPVTAGDVAYTINRVLSPVLQSRSSVLLQPIVGAQDVLDGKAASASGVVASGQTLTIRLTHQVGDFDEGAAAGICVVPRGTPIDPAGVQPPVPSAAPYYVSEFVPSQRLVLERNTYYAGPRPHHVDRIVFDLAVFFARAVDDALTGRADYAWASTDAYLDRAPGLVRLLGMNRTRLFVQPSDFLLMFVLNTSRPLLHDNVPLRRAINYAVDRTALVRQRGRYSGVPTDQFVPPIMPGYSGAHVYPLVTPDLAKARALAKGHTRGGKLVLYIAASPAHPIGLAQIVKRDLSRIGLKVEIRTFPAPLYFRKLATPTEPFDMAEIGFGFPEPDPGAVLTALFDGAAIGTPANADFSYFDSPQWNRALRKASRLTGEARYHAFGALDVRLVRGPAPAVAYSISNALTLVSARTGCVIVNPYLDLAAVCLK